MQKAKTIHKFFLVVRFILSEANIESYSPEYPDAPAINGMNTAVYRRLDFLKSDYNTKVFE